MKSICVLLPLNSLEINRAIKVFGEETVIFEYSSTKKVLLPSGNCSVILPEIKRDTYHGISCWINDTDERITELCAKYPFSFSPMFGEWKRII